MGRTQAPTIMERETQTADGSELARDIFIASLPHQRQGARMGWCVVMTNRVEMVEHTGKYCHGKDRDGKTGDSNCKPGASTVL